MKLRRIAAGAAVALLAATAAADVTAQGFPRRDRGGSPREQGRTPDARRDAASTSTPEPFAALERELPSLQVDLQIRGDQLDEWRVFERDVRDVADMERARRRHLLSLKDTGNKPATALTLIGALAEDDRLKAEAAAELKRHLASLYAKLDEPQRRTLDRRAIQSQTEPLGGR